MKLSKLKNQDFQMIYDLMENSFPSDEYRVYEEQKNLLNNPKYSIYVLYDKSQQIKAFIAAWEFAEFGYIEHFAVNPEYRNGGIGAAMLREFISQSDKLLCLEVEPPTTQIANRRISFYKRNDFYLNDYPYMQPSMSKGKKSIPLCIMTSGQNINQEMFSKIKETLYTEVYNIK